MVYAMKSVAQIYNADAEREWLRLEKTPYQSIEFDVTMHYLLKHLPSTGKILDAGGGPGRYAIELCRRGYEVSLLDISEGCIEVARSKIQSEPKDVQERLVDFIVGDVRNLTHFESNHFDAVICLDPLSYLCDEKERRETVSNLMRITKPQGIICISVRGYFAVLRHMFEHFQENLLDASFDTLVKQGDILVQGVPVHFFRANEIKELAESSGLVTVEMAGCEGLSTGLRESSNQLKEDGARWARWMEVVLKTASEPAIVDMAGHILYVGRKLD